MPSAKHTIICGGSGTGKTTFLKMLLAEIKAKGESVIVFDPFHPKEPWAGADFATSNYQLFETVYSRSRNCHVFIDESGTAVSRDSDKSHLATQSRHLDHRVYFVVHHINQLLPVVRFQCSRVALFRTAVQGAKILAEQYADPALEGAPNLHLFEYYWKPDPYTPARKLRLPVNFTPPA